MTTSQTHSLRFLCLLEEGLDYDQMLRAVYLCLSLSKHYPVQVWLEDWPNVNPRWGGLLTAAQAEQFYSMVLPINHLEYETLQAAGLKHFNPQLPQLGYFSPEQQARRAERLAYLQPFMRTKQHHTGIADFFCLYLTRGKSSYTPTDYWADAVVLLDRVIEPAWLPDRLPCLGFTGAQWNLPRPIKWLPAAAMHGSPKLQREASVAAECAVVLADAPVAQVLQLATWCAAHCKQVFIFDVYAYPSYYVLPEASNLVYWPWQHLEDCFAGLPPSVVLACGPTPLLPSQRMLELIAQHHVPLHVYLPADSIQQASFQWDEQHVALAWQRYRQNPSAAFERRDGQPEDFNAVVQQLVGHVDAKPTSLSKMPSAWRIWGLHKQKNPNEETKEYVSGDLYIASAAEPIHFLALHPQLRWQFGEHLLEKSHKEAIYFRNSAQGKPQAPWQPADIATLMQEGELDALVADSNLLERLLTMRSHFINHNTPVIGFLTDTNSYHGLQSLCLQLGCHHVLPFDGLIAPSNVALQSYTHLQTAMIDYLQQTHGMACQQPFTIKSIPGGVDVNRYHRLNKLACRHQLHLPGEVLVMASNLKRPNALSKNLLPLMLMYKSLLAQYPQLYWVITGKIEPAEFARLLELVQLPEHQIRVFSHLDRFTKTQVLGGADVWVELCDDIFALQAPLVLEAMSAGLPVVANDWPVHREIIETGKNGFLFATYKQPSDERANAYAATVANAFSHAHTSYDFNQTVAFSLPGACDSLQQLLGSVSLRQSIGEAARQHVLKHFCRHRQLDKMVDFIGEQINQARALPTLNVEKSFLDDINVRFQHYPDKLFDLQAPLRLGRFLQEEMLRQVIYKRVVNGDADEAAFVETLEAALQHKPLSGQTLLDYISRHSAYSPQQCRIRLVRLLKFGFLEFAGC